MLCKRSWGVLVWWWYPGISFQCPSLLLSFTPLVNPAVHDLGKQPYLPTLLATPLQIPRKKQDIAEQSSIKRCLIYCTIQSPLSRSLSSSLPYPPTSANRPEGRVSTHLQVPALALWEGQALMNGYFVGEEVRGVCVLGKQGFMGCDCLIAGGLSFHSFPVWAHTTVVSPGGCYVSGFWDLLSPRHHLAPPGLLTLQYAVLQTCRDDNLWKALYLNVLYHFSVVSVQIISQW